MIQDQIPEFYSQYFPRSLLQAEVNEKLATCENCLMARELQDSISYKANLKCCTFHPFQPNYLMGGLLKSGTADFRALESIERKVQSREYVLPIGIVAPVPHQLEFQARTRHEFGNREDWLCPYYNQVDQNCGIWKFRGAVCSTFFCRSSYGKAGSNFWERFSDYLTYVEMALMEEALVMLDFSPRQISDNIDYLNRFEANSSERVQKELPEKLARKIWNGYFDDQLGFYKKCYEIVANMTKTQFKEAMGEQGQVIEKDLMKGLRALKLPAKEL